MSRRTQSQSVRRAVVEALESRQLLHGDVGSDTFSAFINFQPAGAAVPGGYVADTGAVFAGRGNGFAYGWNVDNGANARDRNLVSDQRRDTLNHMQKPGGATTWELQVPNGHYNVRIVAGDPMAVDSVYKLNAEGVLVVNATPSSSSKFAEATREITVSDGRLTITNASGAVNNKISYVEVTPVEHAAPAGATKVNFQPSGAPIPGGYLADTGATFGNRGNGQSYGWNVNNAEHARDRNAVADQRIDTFTHMQKPGGATTWEMAVANGSYAVRIVSGDPWTVDSVHKINAEGVLVVNGTPTTSNRYVEGTKTVNVTDGRLTVTIASGAVNAKISYIEVTPTTVTPPQGNTINWTTVAPSPVGKSEALRATVGGKLYVFGGFQGNLGPVVRSDVYNPATNTWTQIADMKTRATHAGVASDSRYVYIVGGYIGTGPGYTQRFGSTEARRYDTVTNTWLDLPKLPLDVAGGGAALVDGKLHYFGGCDIQRRDTGVHLVLDLAAGATSWTFAASMPDPRSHFGTVTLDGKVYAIAGQHGNDAALTTVRTVTVYDPATGQWSTKAPAPTAVSHISSSTFVHNGRIVVAGGETAHGVATAEVRAYDPATNAWVQCTSLPAQRISGVADAIGGVIYFTTGSGTTTTYKGVFA